MNGEPRLPEHEDIQELLGVYERLCSGKGSAFLSEESFERIIDYFDEADALTKALEAAKMGVLQFPYSSALLVKKADLHLAERQYQQALDDLDMAQILDPNEIDIYILRTDAYLALDMQEMAVSLLEEAILRFEGDERIDLLFELADVYDDYEAFDKLFDCLALILTYDPNNQEALYKICFWTDFTGRNGESIEIHLKIIEEYPYNDLAWFNLAAAYQGLRLYEKAIDAYKFAIAINEKFDYAYRNMADAQMRLHLYRDAIESLEKVIELARPEDLIYQALGLCYEKIRNHSQARFYYRKASHLNPDNARIYLKIAATYTKEGKHAQAVKYLEMGLTIKRLDPEFNLLMGESLVRLGRIRDAVHYFLSAVSAKPRNIKGWEALIRTLFLSGQLSEAGKQLFAAKERLGDKPLLMYYESAILINKGKIKDGFELLEKALEKNHRMLKNFLKLFPSVVKHPQVVELILKYRRRKRL